MNIKIKINMIYILWPHFKPFLPSYSWICQVFYGQTTLILIILYWQCQNYQNQLWINDADKSFSGGKQIIIKFRSINHPKGIPSFQLSFQTWSRKSSLANKSIFPLTLSKIFKLSCGKVFFCFNTLAQCRWKFFQLVQSS